MSKFLSLKLIKIYRGDGGFDDYTFIDAKGQIYEWLNVKESFKIEASKFITAQVEVIPYNNTYGVYMIDKVSFLP